MKVSFAKKHYESRVPICRMDAYGLLSELGYNADAAIRHANLSKFAIGEAQKHAGIERQRRRMESFLTQRLVQFNAKTICPVLEYMADLLYTPKQNSKVAQSIQAATRRYSAN